MKADFTVEIQVHVYVVRCIKVLPAFFAKAVQKFRSGNHNRHFSAQRTILETCARPLLWWILFPPKEATPIQKLALESRLERHKSPRRHLEITMNPMACFQGCQVRLPPQLRARERFEGCQKL